MSPPPRHIRRADPTRVLWRRIAAYLVDGAVGTLLVIVAVIGFADLDVVDVADCPDDLPGGRLCVDGPYDDDTVVVADTGAAVAAGALAVGWAVLNDVVLQGLTGATAGKFITAIRTVRPDGSRPGIGRALVRTLLLVIDGLSLVLPLGLWIAMFSRGHRRLGDMAADTYVVRASAAGMPVAVP